MKAAHTSDNRWPPPKQYGNKYLNSNFLTILKSRPEKSSIAQYAAKIAMKNNSSNRKNKPEPIIKQQIDRVEKQNRCPQSATSGAEGGKKLSE